MNALQAEKTEITEEDKNLAAVTEVEAALGLSGLPRLQAATHGRRQDGAIKLSYEINCDPDQRR